MGPEAVAAWKLVGQTLADGWGAFGAAVCACLFLYRSREAERREHAKELDSIRDKLEKENDEVRDRLMSHLERSGDLSKMVTSLMGKLEAMADRRP